MAAASARRATPASVPRQPRRSRSRSSVLPCSCRDWSPPSSTQMWPSVGGKVGAFWAMLLFLVGDRMASYALLRSLEGHVWSRLLRRLHLERLWVTPVAAGA